MPKLEPPKFVQSAEQQTPCELVDEVCAQIDAYAEEIDARRKWLTDFLQKNGVPQKGSTARRLGRAMTFWKGLKPSLDAEKTLRYLARFKPDLLAEVTARKIVPEKWNDAVKNGRVPSTMLAKLQKPSDPQLILQIDPQE